MNDEDMDWLQEVKVFVIDGALVVTVFCMLVVLALLDALERKDRLLDSLRKAFELVRKDVLNPEELNALGKLRIEAITKELTP